MNPSWRKNYLRYKSFFLNVLGQYKARADLKVYLEIFLSLATVSVFSIFALRPTLLTISELITEIETKEETLERVDEKLANLSEARSAYNRQSGRIETLRSAFPVNSSPEVFVRQIEGIAGRNGVTTANFSFSNATILGAGSNQDGSEQNTNLPEGVSVLPFTFTAVGEYQNLFNLLEDMTSLRQPIVINGMTFQETVREEEVVLTISVNANVPYLPREDAQ